MIILSDGQEKPPCFLLVGQQPDDFPDDIPDLPDRPWEPDEPDDDD